MLSLSTNSWLSLSS